MTTPIASPPSSLKTTATLPFGQAVDQQQVRQAFAVRYLARRHGLRPSIAGVIAELIGFSLEVR